VVSIFVLQSVGISITKETIIIYGAEGKTKDSIKIVGSGKRLYESVTGNNAEYAIRQPDSKFTISIHTEIIQIRDGVYQTGLPCATVVIKK
jgi:hypothetical protein